MIEIADAIPTAADAAVEYGPTGLAAILAVYAVKGVPRFTLAVTRMIDSATKILDVGIGFITGLNDLVSLGRRWLRKQLNEPDPKESGDQTVVRKLADDVTDEELLLVLNEMDPTDSVPLRLAAKGDQLRRVAKLYARAREESGPRRSA